MTSGLRRLDVRDLARPQLAGDVRLQQVVGAGRTAADMALRHGHDVESRRGEHQHRRRRHLLAVLQGAGGMIGDAQAGRAGARPDVERPREFR